jgi:hypothetical protein
MSGWPLSRCSVSSCYDGLCNRYYAGPPWSHLGGGEGERLWATDSRWGGVGGGGRPRNNIQHATFNTSRHCSEYGTQRIGQDLRKRGNISRLH